MSDSHPESATTSIVSTEANPRSASPPRARARSGELVTSASRGQAEPAPWVSIERAAAYLDLSASGLRKSLERRAVRVSDGGIEAMVDGVRGRKFGRLWRVKFSEAWGAP